MEVGRRRRSQGKARRSCEEAKRRKRGCHCLVNMVGISG